MDARELAKKMLQWQEAQAHADVLKMDIEAAVLELGKTQTVGNVRATYSAGRKSYDYPSAFEAAVKNGVVSPSALNPFIQIIPETTQIDYTAACKALNIPDIPFTKSAPSVSLKMVA